MGLASCAFASFVVLKELITTKDTKDHEGKIHAAQTSIELIF